MVAIRQCVLLVVLSLCAALQAIAAPVLPGLEGAAPSQAGGQDKAQIRSDGDVPVFRSRVNLVMVPVVVRDSQGNSIGDLRREDFQLLDDGKPQVIRHFAVERPEPREAPASAEAAGKGEATRPAAPKVPRRFIAWVLDDVSLVDMGEVAAVKAAANRILDTLRPGDRVAIRSVSGLIALDFTDDIPALREAVSRLLPRFMLPESKIRVQGHLGLLRELTRALSIRPGERAIVIVSPGFWIPDSLRPDLPELIDQAIQSNIVISSLDTRGVYTLSTFDASNDGPPRFTGVQQAMQNAILEYLADGTGGAFFHSDNSIYEGFRRTSEAAEYRYVLGFSPKEWHSDRDFHRLKVKVNRPGVTIQARRGYSFDAPDGGPVLVSQQKKNTPAPKESGEQRAAATVPQAGANLPAQGTASSEKLPIFKSQVNLVMVPVVVRDSHGNSIGDLRREDFQLLDDGKPQEIRHFAVERPEPREPASSADGADKGETKSSAGPKVPRRFIAWVIDDFSLENLGEVDGVRKAAIRKLDELRPGDRVAIYTVSGLIAADFTDDVPALRKAVSRLVPRDLLPLNLIHQAKMNPSANHRQERPFELVRELVRVMSLRAGERTIVMISPGWQVEGWVWPELPELLDQAIQANVVINTLDTTGVGGQSPILEYLADGTGGVYFHSDNSIYEGFRRTTDAAEYRYILGFSPKEWHSEADFHRLKVKVDRSWVTIQARRGYSFDAPDGGPVLVSQQKKNMPAPKESGEQRAAATVPQAGANPPAQGAASSEKLPTFKSRVNLVMVPVVVRDSQGKSIGDLRREDFQLFDDGKPQEIKHFAIERPEPREAPASAGATGKGETGISAKSPAAPKVPRRFIAWIIDDTIDPGLFSNVKLAVDRMVDELQPGDRVALYKVSDGRLPDAEVEFTDNPAVLRKAIMGFAPMPGGGMTGTQVCMDALKKVMREISIRPGERTIVMVTPGFPVFGNPFLSDYVDRAIEANVVINTLDPRGVYTPGVFDIDNDDGRAKAAQNRARMAAMQDAVLEYLADGTGGVFFHSDNDLHEGLRRTTEAAEYRYILGFSPKEWHAEDDFHRLKVKVERPGITIQARRGYSFGSPDGGPVRPGSDTQVSSASGSANLGHQNLQNKNAPGSTESEKQNPRASAAQAESALPASKENAEEKLPTFKSQVNLVMVPVVVRDSKGNAVGNLKRDNFRVFDNGKQQKIKQFSVESAASRAASTSGKADAAKTGEAKVSVAPTAARRFIAYVFDDLHLDIGDLVPARKAAERQLAAMEPGERVALYTTSGRNSVEFTEDTAKLREALLRMTPRAQVHECPDLGAHWAAQIDDLGYNTSNPVVSAAMGELQQCPGNSGMPQPMLQGMLRGVVSRILAESERDAQFSVALLRNVVSRMSSLPGERTIVTVSPGFMPRRQEQQLAQVIERAVQAKVVVNTLDARGVYTNSMFDASSDVLRPNPVAMQVRMEMASLQADVLEELADGTGGLFFHSNNDMNEGFHKTAGVAEYTYMLGFTPELSKDRKADPEHKLKVKVEDAGGGLSIQARRSYRVDTEPANPLKEEQQQIRMAMYSRADMTEIPIKLSTQVSKSSTGDATLKLTVQLDLKDLPLRKVGDRNSDDLEVHAGVFDHNGKYVTGKGNKVELRLLDQTVARVNSGAPLAQGSNLDMDFALKPGDYVVRVVVREAENQLMSAASSTVQIP